MKIALLMLLVIGALMCAGCGSVPPTYYYRIDYTVSNPAPQARGLPYILGVAQFNADALYESDRIVYRESAYQAQFYHYRRWVAAPKKIVTEKVVEHYRSAGVFDKVVRIPSTFKMDYVLRGNIHALEEWDDDDQWFGVVTIGFVLQDATTHEIMWEKTLTDRTLVSKKEPVQVVRAISESLNKVVASSILQIHDHLKASNSN